MVSPSTFPATVFFAYHSLLALHFIARLALADPAIPPPEDYHRLAPFILSLLPVLLTAITFSTVAAFAFLFGTLSAWRRPADLRVRLPVFGALSFCSTVCLPPLSPAAATLLVPTSLIAFHAVATRITTHLRQASYLPIFGTAPSFVTQEYDSTLPPVPPRLTDVSLFSILTFHWAQPLVATGLSRPLHLSDVPPLASRMRSAFLSAIFAPHLAAALASPQPSLWRALAAAFGLRFALAGVLRVAYIACNLALPLLVRAIILHIQSSETASITRGFGLAAAIFFTTLAQSQLVNHYHGTMIEVQSRVQAALIDQIYAKVTRLSVTSLSSFSRGFINNLMAVDTKDVSEFLLYSHMLWGAPLQIIASHVILYNLLGAAATAASAGVVVLSMPFQIYIMRGMRSTKARASARADQRVKLVSEAVHGIEVVKFQSWTAPVLATILDIRVRELALIRIYLYLEACIRGVITSISVLLTLAALSAYVLTGGALDASVIFPAITVFQLLRVPLVVLPDAAVDATRATAAAERILSFLIAQELPALAPPPSSFADADIFADGAATAWDPSTGPSLCNINLSVPAGSLTCVLGAVASGKSTLLASLLGEVPVISGTIGVRPGASVSFCAQTPFIRNATLRDNILFGAPYDETRYRRALTLACMMPDLTVLPSGDGTEIGGRGVNLSGGQQARCALARAVYNQADVVLLDDPLAAVDAHVGRQIWEQCIVGEMKGCTRLMATSSLHFGASSAVHFIVVVDEGRVVEFGRRKVLAEDATSAFSRLLAVEKAALGSSSSEHALKKEGEVEAQQVKKGGKIENEDPIFPAPHLVTHSKGRLVQGEHKSRGGVALSTYANYIRASGGTVVACFVLALLLTSVLAQVGSSLYLAKWSQASRLVQYESAGESSKLFVYAVMSLVASLLPALTNVVIVGASIRASVVLHERLCVGVFGSPMSWFHTTPTGRIVNRFSSSIENVDYSIGVTIQILSRLVINSLSAFAVVAYATPSFLGFILPAGALFGLLHSYYRTTAIDLRRLEGLARSPLYSHFDETLDGIMTLRAFRGGASKFLRENQQLAEVSVGTTYATKFASRWLAVRADFITVSLTFVAAILAVLVSRISPELAGLSLTYSLQTVALLGLVVSQATEAESQMSYLEQLGEYSDTAEHGGSHPQEDHLEVAELAAAEGEKRDWKGLASDDFVRSLSVSAGKHRRASSAWPSRGGMKFSNVSMRYRPELALALDGVSFDVQSGWHVGCVGRTGAGKSSLVGSIMRMQELAGGQIVIDGRDISKLPLQTLRSSLSVVPQAPVLFSGTLRFNLDMAGVYSDEECRSALEVSGLQSTVADGALTLDTVVSEGGSSLSHGQRQLLCLGRVLLRNSMICVFDEASSSVDQETDRAMLATIRTHFGGKTLFIIAHRLQTIVSCDRVIVMDAGKVAEFGSPADLVAQPNTRFGSLIDQTGPESAARLRALAIAGNV